MVDENNDPLAGGFKNPHANIEKVGKDTIELTYGNHALIENNRDGIFYSPSALLRAVKIGRGSKIWHHSNLYGCEIGEDTQIGAFCEIKKDANIGSHCRLQSHVFIPELVEIGNYVFIGPHVCFTNERWPSAVKAIEKCGKLEKTVVEDYAMIGANSTILSSLKIGAFALIGAGSKVTRDVERYAIVDGNPAVKKGDIRDERFIKKYHELENHIERFEGGSAWESC